MTLMRHAFGRLTSLCNISSSIQWNIARISDSKVFVNTYENDYFQLGQESSSKRFALRDEIHEQSTVRFLVRYESARYITVNPFARSLQHLCHIHQRTRPSLKRRSTRFRPHANTSSPSQHCCKIKSRCFGDRPHAINMRRSRKSKTIMSCRWNARRWKRPVNASVSRRLDRVLRLHGTAPRSRNILLMDCRRHHLRYSSIGRQY